MTDLFAQLRTDFGSFISAHGVPISIQNRKLTHTASDYDTGTLSNSGTAVTGSAFVLPVSNKNGDDARFIEQGLITQADKKIYIPSGIEINEKAQISGTAVGEYAVVDMGIHDYPDESRLVYKRVYMRTKRP
jgi:hypothetical protein